MGEGADSDWNNSTQRSHNAHLLQKFNELLQRHKVHSHWRVVVIFFRIFSYFFASFRELSEENTTANGRGRGLQLAVVFSYANSRKDTKKYEDNPPV